MIIIVIVIFLVDRWITKVSCLALYKGKWKKIEKSITGENIFEKIISVKYDIANDEMYKFDEYEKDIDAFYNRVMEKNA